MTSLSIYFVRNAGGGSMRIEYYDTFILRKEFKCVIYVYIMYDITWQFHITIENETKQLYVKLLINNNDAVTRITEKHTLKKVFRKQSPYSCTLRPLYRHKRGGPQIKYIIVVIPCYLNIILTRVCKSHFTLKICKT